MASKSSESVLCTIKKENMGNVVSEPPMVNTIDPFQLNQLMFLAESPVTNFNTKNNKK